MRLRSDTARLPEATLWQAPGRVALHALKFRGARRVRVAVVAALALCSCGDGGQAVAELGCRGTEPARWSGRVPVGDASLYMLVRGARCDAPVLLWLHGGPGGAERPLFRLYDRDLEDQFVVAYWTSAARAAPGSVRRTRPG